MTFDVYNTSPNGLVVGLGVDNNTLVLGGTYGGNEWRVEGVLVPLSATVIIDTYDRTSRAVDMTTQHFDHSSDLFPLLLALKAGGPAEPTIDWLADNADGAFRAALDKAMTKIPGGYP